MARGRIADKVKNSIKIAVYGAHGTRKSNFLSDFAKMKREDGKPMRVLYIDPENGSLDGFALDRLEAEGVDISNIYIYYASAYGEIEEVCERAIKNGYFYEIDEVPDEDTGELEWIEQFGQKDKMILDSDGNPFIADAICIDGITVVADGISDSAISLSEKRAGIKADSQGKNSNEKEVMVGTAGLEFKDHSKIKGRGKRLIHKLIKSTDKHIGISLRGKPEKFMLKDEKNQMILTATGKEIPETWAFILYDVYTVVHCEKDKEGNVFATVEDKDRSGMFAPNTELEEISVSLWQPVIEKNKNKQKGVGTSAESYDKLEMKNETAYKEIIGEPAKEKTKSKQETLETKEDYLKACVDLKASLSATKKRSMKTKLDAKKLPVSGWEELEVEKLKEIYELLKG